VTEISDAAAAAIDKVLKIYQELADEERKAAPRRVAAQKEIDQLIDDLASIGKFDGSKVTSEMMGAFAIFERQVAIRSRLGDPVAQMSMAKFDRDFMEGLKAHFQAIQRDPVKMMEMQQEAMRFSRALAPPKVQVNLPTFDVAMGEPEGAYGEWTVAVVPVVVDSEYRAKLAEKLDFDLYLSIDVTPHKSLTSEFNIPGKIFRAGEKIEPMIITHETSPDTPDTMVHIRGHVYKDGAYTQPLDFPPLSLQKQGGPDMGMDMEAMMRLLMGGGPKGPKMN